jgi:glycosyltransferase involved in cell wall biosynthesis
VVFPVIGNYDYGYGDRRIHWIPDFQVNNLPFFFSEEEKQSRESSQRETSKSRGEALVVSSEHALADYLKFYPEAVTQNYVLPFAVTHGDIAGLSIEKLRQKFNLQGDYFISPNQFWAQKNHKVILEAVNAMVKRKKGVKVVFTGKEHDHRSPGYFDELKQYVNRNGLGDHVSFLGFIDRNEQLKLIENAIAVIQPSRFEGWSSVVEDGKALSKRIIASDIPVHREQLRDQGVYFGLADADGLAEKMERFLHTGRETVDYGYGNEKKIFGRKFVSVVESVIGK